MWLILLAILAVVFVALLIQIFSKSRDGSRRGEHEYRRDEGHASASHMVSDVTNLSVRDAQHRDAISIPGQGDSFSDLEFVVDRRNRYQSGEEEWFELSGMYRGRRVHSEVSEDDELQATLLADATTFRLDELGLAEEDLIRMDEEQSRGNRFSFQGEEWIYASSQEIGYFKDGRGDGEGYYNWDFESEGGDRLLSIEKWEGEPFEAMISKRLHPDDIRVFRR